MQFSFVASPSPDALLTHYDAERFPMFQCVFEEPAELSSPMQHFWRYPREAAVSLVLENNSPKDITALRYRWLVTKLGEKLRPSVCSSDSYLVDVYHPVLAAGDRKLIGPSIGMNQSLLEHVQRGGGSIGSGNSGGPREFYDADEINFSIDLILFADGEIAGPDPDHYTGELICRKPAAEFVAKQIRLADAESRDPAPVLKALAEIPRDRNDVLVEWVHTYAQRCLAAAAAPNSRIERVAGMLRHLESRPVLPRFYRRGDAPRP